MQKTVLIVLLFISLHAISQPRLAPESPAALNMGGGSVSITSDFVLDWSIGESTVIETYYGENSYSNSIVGVNWNVTSGILQPFDKNHIIYNFLVPKWTNKEIRFYPVPTANVVHIDFRSVTTGKVSLQLLSREGKLLGVKEFYQNNSTSSLKWDLTNKASGVYYFHILLTGANGEVLKQGTFNIEKL